MRRRYQASDPATEDALWERLSFRRFVWLGLQDTAPEHSTISRFRTQLTTAGLAERLFAAVEQQLTARDVLVQQDTLVDAQVRRPRAARRRRAVPATRTRPGPAGAARRLRVQAAPGVDAASELVRRAVLTPANVNET